MSRYAIPVQPAVLATRPHLQAAVGWDNPMQTFFGQVLDPSLPDDQQEAVLWIGTTHASIPGIQALIARMAPWAVIPSAIRLQLCKDYDARTAPTPLQQAVHGLFSRLDHTPEDEGS